MIIRLKLSEFLPDHHHCSLNQIELKEQVDQKDQDQKFLEFGRCNLLKQFLQSGSHSHFIHLEGKKNGQQIACRQQDQQQYRNFENLYKQHNSMLVEEGIDDLKFNIFKANQIIGRENSLIIITYHFLSNNEILRSINQDKLMSFLSNIYQGYRRDVAYHNDLHGADVVQSSQILLNQGLRKMAAFDALDEFSFIIACACHDYKHDGFNNQYHINSLSERAIRYNDVSVQENFHVASAFEDLMRPENNFLEQLDITQQKIFRKRMIESILATDMAKHFDKLKAFQQCIQKDTLGFNTYLPCPSDQPSKQTQDLFNIAIHAADLGIHCRTFELSLKWSELLHEEFFFQGDEERRLGLPTMDIFDRVKNDVSKNQIGFIKFFVLPLYISISEVVPDAKEQVENIESNIENWGTYKYTHPKNIELE
ncbi:iesterase family member [Stylonychia lemnae]|uniref:Phosphodiesterase n=1 Tax=Stylonychia lemnae TaxID=5949 RepID=A0A077ZVN2_STYLE|nr:iesterase family member [Stylonychia lemnae]|eukprot:CDW73305.1 iesterase family member [Stylonychia lemnae]